MSRCAHVEDDRSSDLGNATCKRVRRHTPDLLGRVRENKDYTPLDAASIQTIYYTVREEPIFVAPKLDRET